MQFYVLSNRYLCDSLVCTSMYGYDRRTTLILLLECNIIHHNCSPLWIIFSPVVYGKVFVHIYLQISLFNHITSYFSIFLLVAVLSQLTLGFGFEHDGSLFLTVQSTSIQIIIQNSRITVLYIDYFCYASFQHTSFLKAVHEQLQLIIYWKNESWNFKFILSD